MGQCISRYIVDGVRQGIDKIETLFWKKKREGKETSTLGIMDILPRPKGGKKIEKNREEGLIERTGNKRGSR